MATSLIGGLIANRHEAGEITACDVSPDQLQQLHDRFQIKTSTEALGSASDAERIG